MMILLIQMYGEQVLDYLKYSRFKLVYAFNTRKRLVRKPWSPLDK